MKSRQTNTPVDNLTLGERENEDDKHRELLRAGAKTRLLKLAGIGKEDKQEESTGSPRETEHPLTPEQKEMVSTRLKERFEAKENQKLYEGTGITWKRVESAMEDEDWLCAYRAEQLGHKPAIFMADNEGFWFGTRTDETPQSTRNCVYDEKAAEWVKENSPNEQFDGSAEGQAKVMGLHLMTVDQGEHIAKNTGPRYEQGWSYYRTPEDIRKAGDVLRGRRLDYNLFVYQRNARYHDYSRGWRGTRRVLYKKGA